MKQTRLQFLDFSKKERTGIYVLLFVSTCVWVLPVFFSNENIDISTVEVTMLEAKIRKLKNDSLTYSASEFHESENHVSTYPKIDRQSLFYFDPNTIGKQEWIKLGVKAKTAETILKYVTAGGRFRDKHDLSKIFGLPHYQIERLMPYVVLSEVKENIRDEPIYKKKEIRQIHIDLNTADSISLMLAPGIGQKIAGRIIKYRDRLGGFVSISQLSEVYGITDSLLIRLQSIWFISLPLQVKKLEVNLIDIEELRKHPYVSFSMSKHIIAFRKSHGRITDSEELNGIVGIDREKLARLIPYLEY